MAKITLRIFLSLSPRICRIKARELLVDLLGEEKVDERLQQHLTNGATFEKLKKLVDSFKNVSFCIYIFIFTFWNQEFVIHSLFSMNFWYRSILTNFASKDRKLILNLKNRPGWRFLITIWKTIFVPKKDRVTSWKWERSGKVGKNFSAKIWGLQNRYEKGVLLFLLCFFYFL